MPELIVGEKQGSVSVSESESESKGSATGLGHERLDVYRPAIDDVGWAYHFCEELKGHRNAKDQLQEEVGDYHVSRGDTDTDADPDPERKEAGKSPTRRWTE